MSDRTLWSRNEPKRHAPTLLREVSTVRCVGFRDAVEDLGKHEICGVKVYYSVGMVRNLLKGKTTSEKLLKLIAEKRPEFFKLRYVCEEVREWAIAHGCDV